MDFDRFFKFSQLLLRDEFVLSYSGYVSEDILLAVGDTLRERLEDHARDGAQIRNVFSIFVELMQNIIRYGVEGPQPGPADGEKPSFGIVMVSENDGHMDVIAGNYVANDEAGLLVDRVRQLQERSPEELRQMYRERLKLSPDQSSKGASLGRLPLACLQPGRQLDAGNDQMVTGRCARADHGPAVRCLRRGAGTNKWRRVDGKTRKWGPHGKSPQCSAILGQFSI